MTPTQFKLSGETGGTLLHLLLCLIICGSVAKAQTSLQVQPHIDSAQAFPGETYEQAKARHRQVRELYELPSYSNSETSRALLETGSAESYKQPFKAGIDVSILPRWTAGAAKFEEAFKRSRNLQLYTDEQGRKRRATWFYPQDGCYARAEHDSRVFEMMGFPRPGKVFIFGTWATLRAKTPYSSSGKVWWSYHTVSAYRLGNRAIIMDAALDPNRLLPIEEWVGLLAPDPNKITVAVCDSNAYAPSSTCIGGLQVHDQSARNHLTDYFDEEWSNLLELGLSPQKLLGAAPPWK